MDLLSWYFINDLLDKRTHTLHSEITKLRQQINQDKIDYLKSQIRSKAPSTAKVLLEWKSSSTIPLSILLKSPLILLAIVSLIGLIVYSLVYQEFLLLGLLILVFLSSYLVYAAPSPHHNHSITDLGLVIGPKFYPWPLFRHYSLKLYKPTSLLTLTTLLPQAYFHLTFPTRLNHQINSLLEQYLEGID